jgi:hypothetical protein
VLRPPGGATVQHIAMVMVDDALPAGDA